MDFDLRPAALRAAAGAIASWLWGGRCARPGPFVGSACAAVAATLVLGLLAAAALAQQPPQIIFNKQLRDEAVRSIPWDGLSEPVRAKLLSVVSRPTIFRRLPVQSVDCDPDLHVFLLRYPEVVVNIWQLMGVTKVKLNRTGPLTFDAQDGAGTVSRAELVYGTPELHVYYADGVYEGPLFQRPVTGNCVLLLRSSYSARGGKTLVTDTLDVFAKLDHLGAEIIVKTLYPAVAKAVDFNFAESVKFVGQVSQAAELNGPGMQRLATHLRNVQPDVRESFAKHIEIAYQRAVLRKGEPAAPLASSATQLPVEPALDTAEVSDAPAERPSVELKAPAAVPSAQVDPAQPREKPVFRR